MEEIEIKKPEWSKEPANLDFNLVNQPLEEIKNYRYVELGNREF